MSEQRPIPSIDIEAIRLETKRCWKEANREQQGVLAIIDKTVPGWLIVIAVVMYLLSAPHTAAMFDKITPGWGWTAPAGVEFGLVYVAFRRKRSEKRHLKTPWSSWFMVVLLFITSIVVNGAGALSAAVQATGIQELSYAQLADRFGTLPLLTQVALFLVILAALIIPLGTTVAGEGLAALFFDRDVASDDLDKRWAEVEYHELRKAFFTAYTRAGMRPGDAKRQATVIASGFIMRDEIPALPAAVLPVRPVQTEQSIELLESGQETTKRDQARRLLAENPDLAELSVRKLEQQTGIKRNVWEAVRKNGHKR